MTCDYSFFERTLSERKRYRVTSTWHLQFADFVEREVKSELGLPRRKWFDVINRSPDGEFMDIEGQHSMNPGISEGALSVEQSFSVSLPDDIHSFYERWGGGFLLAREYYYILSPNEVISVCSTIRKIRAEPLNARWRIIRFCDLGNGNFLALQQIVDKWRVIFASVEYDDEMILKEELGQPIVLADSFYEWLKTTVERDGEFEDNELRSPSYDGIPACTRLN